MGLHRLLQRAFARLYKYDLPQDPVPDAQSSSDAPPLSDFDDYMDGVLAAENMKGLHHKLKGARVMSVFQH